MREGRQGRKGKPKRWSKWRRRSSKLTGGSSEEVDAAAVFWKE